MRTPLLAAFLLFLSFTTKAQVQASFTYPTNCLPNGGVQFTNTSTGAFTYSWDFGDPASGAANTSTSANPVHMFSSSGPFNVSLQVVGSGGSFDDTTMAVTVRVTPNVAYGALSAVCLNAGLTNIATGTVTNGVSGIGAYYGPGVSTSGIFDPSVAGVGTHTVRYVFKSTLGCHDSVYQTVTVDPTPATPTVANNSPVCTGNTLLLTASNLAGATYNWTGPNGFTSTMQNPTISNATLTNAGSYSVTTTVNGCVSAAGTTTVIVNPTPPAPTVTSNSPVCIGNTINLSTSNLGGANYNWTGPNGFTSTMQNPVIPNSNLANAGTYSVTTTLNGCMSAAGTTNVTVNPKLQASFTVSSSQQCLNGNYFTFINSSSPQSGSYSTSWSFGDGGNSTLSNPAHVYVVAGAYSVKLVVSSGSGCADSTTRTVNVYPAPYASFSVNSATQCLNANNFVFTNTSTRLAGTITYLWKFGDATTSNLENSTHTYTTAGTFRVQLNVYSSFGCKDSAYQMVTTVPYLTGTVNESICSNNLPFTLNGHMYYAAGTYKDTITGSGGCDSVITLNLTVKNATTSTTTTSACSNQFPFVWNGNAYSAPGYYSVIFTNAAGCDSIANLNLSMKPAPRVVYSSAFVDTMNCIKRTVAFSNVFPAATGYYYNWDFGDGSTSTSLSPVHTYASQGIYTVKLTIDSLGCQNLGLSTILIGDRATVMPTIPAALFANRECEADSGWTNYYFNNNTPNNHDDDTLLLSLKKNGNNIGNIGDGTFQLRVVATQGAGSNTGILLTNPLITNPSGYWVMNRYWNVQPTNQPTTPVGVRFYYNTQDLNDVNGSYPSHNLNYPDLFFYKTTNGNPDPTTNLAGATALTTIVNGNTPDTTHWVYSNFGTNAHWSEFEVSHFSGGGGGATGNGQTLPLQLVSFDAIKAGKSNLVNWRTANESRLDRFVVEKSIDGIHFTALASKQPGNARENAYSVIDNNPATTFNYYRLKTIDVEGRASYSVVRALDNRAGVQTVIYPNPVKEVLNLRLTAESQGAVQLEIMSVEGKVLKSTNTSASSGTSTHSINIANLAKGTYVLRVTSKEGTSISKFQKMN